MQNPGRYIILLFMITTALFAVPKDTFQFSMQADKTTAYVGEPVKITFLFKYPIDIQIAEANFAPPIFHDFWIKAGKDVPSTIKEGYHIYHLDYTVTPQKAGTLEIEPARMDIGILKTKQRNTLRFDRVTWKSIFSNNLKISVKPLPDNITLFGNYKITASVDKNSTRENEPVNLTVTVTGDGNMEDIDDFTITSDTAAVYADKAKRSTQFQKGLRKSIFTQKFAFIADRNFTIPSLALTYFNSQTKKVTIVKTDPIPIHVITQPGKFHTAKLEKKASSPLFQSNTDKRSKLWIITLIGGFVAGILATILWIQTKALKMKQQKQHPVEYKLKKAKDNKSLLGVLLPYKGKSPELDEIIHKLEANVYENAKYKIDKKDLQKNFAKYVTINNDEAEILL